jgi:hypothetical protein
MEITVHNSRKTPNKQQQLKLPLTAYSVATGDAQRAIQVLQMAFLASRIVEMTGRNAAKPNNDVCSVLARKTKQPKALRSHSDGAIFVSKGGSADVVVTGAQAAYIYPLFGEPDRPTVIATLTGEDTVEIAASKDAKTGVHPFLLGDGVIGEPLSVIIPASFDEETCEKENSVVALRRKPKPVPKPKPFPDELYYR